VAATDENLRPRHAISIGRFEKKKPAESSLFTLCQASLEPAIADVIRGPFPLDMNTSRIPASPREDNLPPALRGAVPVLVVVATLAVAALWYVAPERSLPATADGLSAVTLPAGAVGLRRLHATPAAFERSPVATASTRATVNGRRLSPPASRGSVPAPKPPVARPAPAPPSAAPPPAQSAPPEAAPPPPPPPSPVSGTGLELSLPEPPPLPVQVPQMPPPPLPELPKLP
jgi:hypothetical protein